jgi:hypothetical protein
MLRPHVGEQQYGERMSPRVDREPAGGPEPFESWLPKELFALVMSDDPGERQIVTAVGTQLTVTWNPNGNRLVLSITPDPAEWSVMGQEPPILGSVRWGGPLLGSQYIPRPRRSEGTRRMRLKQLEAAGWVASSAPSLTATWELAGASASRDARDAAALIVQTLERVEGLDTDPLLLVVYDTGRDCHPAPDDSAGGSRRAPGTGPSAPLRPWDPWDFLRGSRGTNAPGDG